MSLVVVIENESDRERETIKPEKRSRCLSFGCKLLKSSILTYHIGKIDEVMILGIMHGACCYKVICLAKELTLSLTNKNVLIDILVHSCSVHKQ